ncbi:MAG: choice-of-anchor D domain-containing protein [Solirubrobacteraceae bacterium]|jgi:alpha-tubulin suppressor-like RCC1 family protein
MSIKSVVALGAMLLLTWALAPGAASAMAPAGIPYVTGYNGYGELGEGPASGDYRYGPGMLPGLPNVVAVATGYYATLALLSNGTVAAMGYNEYGEVGDGTKTERRSPVIVSGLSSVTAVAEGEYHSLALLSNKTVEAWGYNGYGELGNNGANTETAKPEVVPGLSNVKEIAAGCDASYALLENGTVEAWGYNEYGELGDGTKTERKAPVPVPGLEHVERISAGCDFALALLKNETVEAWGYGDYGELGTGSAKEQLTPEPVPGVEHVTAISAGGYFALALLKNDTIEGWGYNREGELGDGTDTEDRPPEQIPGVSNVAAISAGGYYSLALLTNGTVEGWGYNDYGELGNLGDSAQLSHQVLSFPSAAIGLGHGYSYDAFVIEGAAASVSSPDLTFPGQTVGTKSEPQSIVVTNKGPAPMSVSGDSLSGSGAGAFTKTADSCSGSTLAAEATCTITYDFAPTAAGTDTASLAITSSSVTALPAIALSGTATPHVPPVLGSLLLTASAFPAAHSGPSAVSASASGTYIIYTDTQAATTTFTVQQKLAGMYHGSGKSRVCATAPKHHKHGAKRCSYSKTLGSFTHTDTVGTNALRFTGRVAGKTLARGSYRLSAVAVSPEGSSATEGAAFTVTH